MYTEVLYARINDHHKMYLYAIVELLKSDQGIGLEQLPVLVTKFPEIKKIISWSKTV